MEIKPKKNVAKNKLRIQMEDKVLAYYEKHMKAGSDSSQAILELMKMYGYSTASTIYRMINAAKQRRGQNG